MHLYTSFKYGGVFQPQSIVVCYFFFLESIVYSVFLIHVLTANILDFCLVNWINDHTLTSSTCTLFVSLTYLLERHSVHVQDLYLLQQEMLHMYQVSLLQIGQRVKGDKQCTCNDTKKVACLLWHTSSLVIKDGVLLFNALMNYKTSLFSRACVRPCKIIMAFAFTAHESKVYIKSYHTVGILLLHTSLAQ